MIHFFGKWGRGCGEYISNGTFGSSSDVFQHARRTDDSLIFSIRETSGGVFANEHEYQIPHASRIPTSPQRATFMENEYGWFMRVYGMSFVSSEILKPEPRKHKKIKAQSSEVGTNYRPK